jgi:DNA-binding transcriptional LysR family regulator
MDVDTRLLRYFAAVAEEGNLTRAAQRLYVSQPALTKQIKQLEGRLGVELFRRSREGMALTEPGRTLAAHVPTLLNGWARALGETRRTASQTARVLRVGFIASAANEATPRIIEAFGERRPDWRVDMRQTSWGRPDAGLSEGDADAALLRLPFPGQEALRVEVLLTEPRLIAMKSTHPLAGQEELPFRSLWNEPFVAAPPETGPWRDYWLATDARAGTPPQIGAVTDQPDDWLSAIANGYGIALAPESAARFYARPGIVYRRVTGVTPTQVAIAWSPTDDTTPAVQDFVRCCLAERDAQTW